MFMVVAYKVKSGVGVRGHICLAVALAVADVHGFC